MGNELIEIISIARGVKTNNNVSLKTPISSLNMGVSKELKSAIDKAIKDLKATLFIEKIEIYDIRSGFEIKRIELLR